MMEVCTSDVIVLYIVIALEMAWVLVFSKLFSGGLQMQLTLKQKF